MVLGIPAIALLGPNLPISPFGEIIYLQILTPTSCDVRHAKQKYRKSGNFRVTNFRVLNFHVKIFLWVDLPTKIIILTMKIIFINV